MNGAKIEKCVACGAPCGFFEDLAGNLNPLCYGEILMVDEVNVGGGWGWEIIHRCMYHRDESKPLFPPEIDDAQT